MSFSANKLFGISIKWICGVLGWAFAGPLFGVLGFVAGTIIESLLFQEKGEKMPIGDFSTNLLMIIAAVVKADRPAVKQEEDLVKQFLKKNYGKNATDEAFIQFNEILKHKIPLKDACIKIRANIDYSSRLQFLQFLYKLAKIDGGITHEEQNILDLIAVELRIKQSFETVILHNDAIETAYNLLGVNNKTDVGDIKKAYRKLAVECHPDKVVNLDEELKKSANEKFLELTNAYNILKKEKNFI